MGKKLKVAGIVILALMGIQCVLAVVQIVNQLIRHSLHR